jgi:hypothetical protein
MRDRKVTDRTARAEISCCAPRFADIDVCASTSASRITRLRPGDLRFGDRAWDSVNVEEFVDRLEDLVVTNDRSAIIPGGASQSMEPGLIKRLPAATGGTQIALKGSTTESVACSTGQAEEHVHEAALTQLSCFFFLRFFRTPSPGARNAFFASPAPRVGQLTIETVKTAIESIAKAEFWGDFWSIRLFFHEESIPVIKLMFGGVRDRFLEPLMDVNRLCANAISIP